MPVEAKPLFRPDVLRPHLAGFTLSGNVESARETLARWSGILWSPQAETLKEQELLPDFLTDVFCGILGYTRALDNKDRYTFSRDKYVEVDGEFTDAVLGELGLEKGRFVVAVEGKGPKDPLDRPYAGRKMSAVDQTYRYAINLPCDWLIVTSLRQTRLYRSTGTAMTRGTRPRSRFPTRSRSWGRDSSWGRGHHPGAGTPWPRRPARASPMAGELVFHFRIVIKSAP